MTNTQLDLIAQLKDRILAADAQGRDGWGYRAFDVQEFDGERWVVLTAVTGHEDDEGTLAEVLCRREHYIWIGPRGRVIELNRPERLNQAPALSLPVALKEPFRKPARDGHGRTAQVRGGAA